MIAIVQLYIGVRKGVEVDIKINGILDIALLTKAYHIANNWMLDNNVSIKHI